MTTTYDDPKICIQAYLVIFFKQRGLPAPLFFHFVEKSNLQVTSKLTEITITRNIYNTVFLRMQNTENDYLK